MCNARWYASIVFDNNLTHVLLFYRRELDRQHVIQIFLKPFVNKKLNFNELLLFNIYETYLLDVMWTPYLEETLSIAPAIYTSGMDIWTLVFPLLFLVMVKLHYPNRLMRQFHYTFQSILIQMICCTP
jgi:hypothetical protein